MILNTHPKDGIKYCPRCGCEKFKTSNQGRSFTCEECDFEYYFNSSAAVACLIFNNEGKLLLTRRAIEPAKGMLDLPGGFVEPMERIEEAIVREIREELGVGILKADFMVSFPNEYIFSGFSVFTIDMAFICSIDDLSAIVPADDAASVEFIFPRDIDHDQLCFNSMSKIIDFYIKNTK